MYKKNGSTIVQADAVFALARMSRHQVSSLLSKFPVTNRERQELLPPTERDRLLQPDGELVLGQGFSSGGGWSGERPVGFGNYWVLVVVLGFKVKLRRLVVWMS